MASVAAYPTDFAGNSPYGAYGAKSDRFWSSAEQSAYHFSDYQNYSDYSSVTVRPANASPCFINLDDYSDFSSDDDSEPEMPAALPKSSAPVLSKALHSMESTETASTDAASTDEAASTDAASDDSDAESVGSPKNKGFVYTRDALMLLRVAVGMCAQPTVEWKTQQKGSPAPATADGNGSEWRRAAEQQQQASVKPSNGKLISSPDSWMAQQRIRAETLDTVDDEEVSRRVKSILNKLTVEKFDALYSKLITCGISTVAHIEMLVQEIFEKACMQHHFVEMYGDLCLRLEEWHEWLGHGCSDGFRRILLNQCQCSFEESMKQETADLVGDLEEDEKIEFISLQKQRVLGNIRLIGALLTRGMLAPRVMLSCVEELLQRATPETLESLALLLTIVGPTFDDSEWFHHGALCEIFERVDSLTKDKAVPPRVRFLLRDLLDLRATNWADMKKATKKEAGPMKIIEVHQKAAEDESQFLMPSHGNGSHGPSKSSRRGYDKASKAMKNESKSESKQGSPQKKGSPACANDQSSTKQGAKKKKKSADAETPSANRAKGSRTSSSNWYQRSW